MVRGSVGTPSYILGPFDATCRDQTLMPDALGPDATLGTIDDHPLVMGPDMLPATADDLTHANIDMAFSCWGSHGSLDVGLALPPAGPPAQTKLLMSRSLDGGMTQRPVVAEYCYKGGRVIVDTLTKEFTAHQGPLGTGVVPTFFLINLFSYALGDKDRCVISWPVDARPTSCRNPLNTKEKGIVPFAFNGTALLDVTDIDPATILVEGVPALRSDLEDVSGPFAPFTGKVDCLDCTTAGPDGFLDLTFKVDAEALIAALGAVTDGECRKVKVTATTFGGTPVEGEDILSILKK